MIMLEQVGRPMMRMMASLPCLRHPKNAARRYEGEEILPEGRKQFRNVGGEEARRETS